MKLEHQVVSLDLAKRLKELGVKQESQFNWQEYEDKKTGEKVSVVKMGSFGHLDNRSYWVGESYAAFTVAELGEMLPRYVHDEKGAVRYLQISNGRPTMERWYVSYVFVNVEPDYAMDTEADTEADARAKMLIYLIENNLLESPTRGGVEG